MCLFYWSVKLIASSDGLYLSCTLTYLYTHVMAPSAVRRELGDWMLYDESIRYKAGWVLSIRFMTNKDDHSTGMVHSYLRSMLTHPYARRLLRRVSALSREQ